MLKFLAKFLPLILHELADLAIDKLAERVQKKSDKLNSEIRDNEKS